MYPGKQQRHGTPPRTSPREMAELEDQIVARLKGHVDYRLEGLKAFIADEIAAAKTEMLETLEQSQAQRQSPRPAAYGGLDDYVLPKRSDERRPRIPSRPTRAPEVRAPYGRGQVDRLEDETGIRTLAIDLPRKPKERPRAPLPDDDGPPRVAAPVAVPRQDISAQTSMPLINVDPERQPNGDLAVSARPAAEVRDANEGHPQPPEQTVRAASTINNNLVKHEDVRRARRVKSGSTERSSGSNRSPGVPEVARYMRVTNDFVAEDVIELSIKAGDRVRVNESRPDWTNVTAIDETSGWVPTSHLEPDD
ncbi:hypothetical protein FOZ62_020846 [Perkinsus olseni]|uniref:SH3 domain-containing protein n=1 Tax=Perkinsus olseni TaxID=32597 RepID=A0A7J6TPU2_PEROL|nr:hypothetical protein FOZ62_020846 [Perkinsus olseni]